jgi:hypothetical protein
MFAPIFRQMFQRAIPAVSRYECLECLAPSRRE